VHDPAHRPGKHRPTSGVGPPTLQAAAQHLITSNRIIADWDKYLGDSVLASTILDRLIHCGVLLEFKGRSYRLKQAASRLASPEDRA
jgi:hypothetical protein